MKYQVGDTVLILHSNEEAVVTDIINNKMLMVDVKGVSFPVFMDQVDFPYFKRFSEKKVVPAQKEKRYIDDIRKEKIAEKQKIEDGVWLHFLPVMDADEFGDLLVEELKLHLVNHTSKSYQFRYKLHFFGKPDFELSNNLEPFSDFYLHDIPFEDMNDSPSFEFEFRLAVPDPKKALHVESNVRMKPKQLFARITELQEKNQAGFSHLLFREYPEKKVEEKMDMGPLTAKGYHVYEAGRARQYMEPARSVVDLHIEKLTDDWKHLTNFEILSLQLQTFEKYYELAVAHHQATLIIIHGVGEGVLRDEIHALLRLKKEVKSFINQYHPAYGYGATEIYFGYK